MKKTQFIFMLLVAAALVSCKKPANYGDLTINIDYSVNGKALITDSLCYCNEAGNEFLITEIQWFISKMELQDERGEWISSEQKIFYIDTDIPESQTLQIASIPVGRYKALRFVFGLDEEDNRTGLFTDPPESEMFWPDFLGGGYHYMKLNGKYLNAEGHLAPLAIHLGIGQNEDCTEFYQNYFIVELPIDFTIKENTVNQFDLTMVIDNWFRNPNLYDFNTFGSAIMQNQAAQQALKENGKDVFTTSTQTQQNPTAMKQENLSERFKNTMQKAAPKPHFWTWENVKERFQGLRFKDLKFKI
ncbi:MAG: hypothetical protein IKD78_13445 [Bacteroidales bacterium]|nr:hypothetical protein [Bacteroidales bacterium]